MKKIAQAELKANNLSKSLENLNNIKIEGIVKKVESLGNGLAKAGQAMRGFSLTAAGALTGMFALANSAVSTGDEIQTTADKYNLSAEAIQRWNYIAMQSDVANEQLCSTPCVVHDMFKFLRAIFEFAKTKKRILRENPVEFVNKVEYVPKKKKHRDLDFANLLLSTLKRENSKFYTPVLLALTGGITREEAPVILESDIDYNDHTIQINKALVKSRNEGYVVKDQKTKNRERVYYGNYSIFNELHYFKRKNGIVSDYLCCNENGTMMKIKTLDSGFRKFVKDHNLPHCTFHQLRTVLSDGQNELGFDIYTSADTLGHGDIRVTSKHYRTHNPDTVRKATIEVFKAIT